jgi:hypothetical protein
MTQVLNSPQRLDHLDNLKELLMAFVMGWNAHAHPFIWSARAAAKVIAKYQTPALKVPAA